MGVKQGLTIILEPEMWGEDVVAELVKQGHTVKVLQSHGYDLILGPRAWRLPEGKASLKHINTIIKQAKKLIKAGAVAPIQDLNLPMEVADGMEDTEVPLEETNGTATKRVISAYRPATRKGKPKQRTKVTRGGYAFTDQGCDDGQGC